MIEEYVYIEGLRKAASRICDGDDNHLVGGGFIVKTYSNKGQDLKHIKYYCRNCTRLLYPYYFKDGK